MGKPKPFEPDWCLAPAALLREWMEDNRLSVRVLATCAPRPERAIAEAMIQAVLGRQPLTDGHALMLAKATGIPARFWLSYEHNYRAGLAAGLKDVTPDA